MTVVEPLSAFFMLIVGLSFSSLIALISLYGRLFLGLELPASASCNLTSSRYVSRATDGCTGGFQSVVKLQNSKDRKVHYVVAVIANRNQAFSIRHKGTHHERFMPSRRMSNILTCVRVQCAQ